MEITTKQIHKQYSIQIHYTIIYIIVHFLLWKIKLLYVLVPNSLGFSIFIVVGLNKCKLQILKNFHLEIH